MCQANNKYFENGYRNLSSSSYQYTAMPVNNSGQIPKNMHTTDAQSVALLLVPKLHITPQSIVQTQKRKQSVEESYINQQTQVTCYNLNCTSIQIGHIINTTNELQGLPNVTEFILPTSSKMSPSNLNPKQLKRILIRRKARAKLIAEGKIPETRPKYLHESRHNHALKRSREKNGRFHNNQTGKL